MEYLSDSTSQGGASGHTSLASPEDIHNIQEAQYTPSQEEARALQQQVEEEMEEWREQHPPATPSLSQNQFTTEMFPPATPGNRTPDFDDLDDYPRPNQRISTFQQIRDRNKLLRHDTPRPLAKAKPKRWFSTHNVADSVIPDFFEWMAEDLGGTYFVLSKEIAPTTGREHWHGYWEFSHGVHYQKVAIIDPHGCWEQARGSVYQAHDYVTKSGNIIKEWGTKPMQLRMRERAMERQARRPQSLTFADMTNLIKSREFNVGQIIDQPVYARYQRYFDQLIMMNQTPQVFTGPLESKNFWIWGAAGTGKSRHVWEGAQARGKTIYMKGQNKWWDGYFNHDIILIEDANPEKMRVLVDHMKVWTDRYPFTAEIKGSSRIINHPNFMFIVTSNYDIDDCFPAQDLPALRRRFTVIQWRETGNPDIFASN